jgi:hypothetical protein
MLYPLSYGSVVTLLQFLSTLLSGREVAPKRSDVTSSKISRDEDGNYG